MTWFPEILAYSCWAITSGATFYGGLCYAKCKRDSKTTTEIWNNLNKASLAFRIALVNAIISSITLFITGSMIEGCLLLIIGIVNLCCLIDHPRVRDRVLYGRH